MKRFSASLLIALFGLAVTPALAATILIGEDEEFYVSAPIRDDAYIFGRIVTVEERITGDLITAGGEVFVEADVSEDVTAVGGKVDINGNVGDDVRAGGGEVRIAGLVNGDVLVAGGRIYIDKDSEVAGDVIMGGGEVFVDGLVGGNLIVKGGRISIRGDIEGDTWLAGDSLRIDGLIMGDIQLVGKTISLSEKAIFNGNVEYWRAEGEMDFGSSLKGGEAIFNPDLQPSVPAVSVGAESAIKGMVAAVFGYALLASALLIFLLVFATKKFFKDTAKRCDKDKLTNALIGFLYFAATPVVAFVFFITFIGIPISLYILCIYAFSILFARPIVAVVTAEWLAMKYKWKIGKWKTSFLAILVYAVLKALTFIPVVGWIALAVVICMGFGALLHTKWQRIRKIL